MTMTQFRKCVVRMRYFLMVTVAAFAQVGNSVYAEMPRPMPVESLNSLPFLFFHKNYSDEANLFRMDRKESTITIDGQSYIGFQLWSAVWMDGKLEWLMSTPTVGVPARPWLIVNADGNTIGSAMPAVYSINDYPRILKRYPAASSVIRYESPEVLDHKSHYYLLQPLTGDTPAEFVVALTIQSERGHKEHGFLKSFSKRHERRTPPDVTIDTMRGICRKTGIPAAMEYLTRELNLRMDDLLASDRDANYQAFATTWYAYDSLYRIAWKEAQFGGRGWDDKEWPCAIYDTLFRMTYARQDYGKSVDILCNATGNMIDAGKLGRLAELMDVWEEGMKLGGYRIDPTSYPDLGQPLRAISNVHLRDIPELLPYSLVASSQRQAYSIPESWNVNMITTFRVYAEHLWYRGEWRKALEWLLWTRQIASDPDGQPRPDRSDVWHRGTMQIACCLAEFGFYQEALQLHQEALKAKFDGYHLGRSTINHKLKVIELTMDLGLPLPADVEQQLVQLIEEARGNLYVSVGFVQYARTLHAKALITMGRQAEAEAILEKLIKEECFFARLTRLDHWIDSGRAAGVEDELLALLTQSRTNSHKSLEFRLYRRYADFLESQGRFEESLIMRRETVRLCRIFDYYTFLPLELAKLASLLNRLGETSESSSAAAEAGNLLRASKLPDNLSALTQTVLQNIRHAAVAAREVDPERDNVDLQPVQSVIIPVANAAWTSRLTLTNPSSRARAGILEGVGVPVHFSLLDDSGDIQASIGTTNRANSLSLSVEPGSYRLIALKAGEGTGDQGKFTIRWSAADSAHRTESVIELSEATEVASSAVIEAGAFRLNPFYGVPVYHHYIDISKAELSKPLRFVCSQQARVEIYGMDGTPLAIDGSGNGSLHDAGDELFGSSDGTGNLQMALTSGAVSFMVMVYPLQKLPDDGLNLRIEAWEGESWSLHAEDLLLPTVKK